MLDQVNLPFTETEFIQVFVAWNHTIWPSQILTWILGLVAIGLLIARREVAPRVAMAILALFWVITGIGYHWLFFSAINPAARIFGAFFLAAGALFLVEGGIRNRVELRTASEFRDGLAWLLIGFALIVYPLLGLLVTHPYPETPLFGVTPCPTTIFTFGLLLLVRHPTPLILGAIPFAWALVGGTAPVLLDVPQDLALPIAGLVWIAFTASDRIRGN